MRRLFVLRPQPAAQATIERARALGLDPVAMPLFAIEPIAWQPPDPAGFDALLLTSANALRHSGDGLRRLRALDVVAVGEATATAARAAGLTVVATGGSGVAALLDTIDGDLRLLHLCGEDRIAARARQAITAVPVYRAVALSAPAAIGALAGAAAVVHSPRAAARLAELVDAAGIDRGAVRIAAISPAASAAAGPGWARCDAAERPDDAALLALAARLCDKPGQP